MRRRDGAYVIWHRGIRGVVKRGVMRVRGKVIRDWEALPLPGGGSICVRDWLREVVAKLDRDYPEGGMMS